MIRSPRAQPPRSVTGPQLMALRGIGAPGTAATPRPKHVHATTMWRLEELGMVEMSVGPDQTPLWRRTQAGEAALAEHAARMARLKEAAR